MDLSIFYSTIFYEKEKNLNSAFTYLPNEIKNKILMIIGRKNKNMFNTRYVFRKFPGYENFSSEKDLC